MFVLVKKKNMLHFQLELLIGPGEVKVNLADFDLKMQENVLSTFLKIPIPTESSSGSF